MKQVVFLLLHLRISTFDILIIMCCGVGLFGLVLFGTFLGVLGPGVRFHPRLGKFSAHLALPSSGTSYYKMNVVGCCAIGPLS